MNHDERKALAEQLKANPLFDALISKIEANAIEALVYATNENDRISAQWRVRAARSLREDCEAALCNTPARKGAPC
jgi:hypothetical protein